MAFGIESVHQDEENVQPNQPADMNIDIISDTISLCHQTTDTTTNNNQTEPPFKPKVFIPDLEEQNPN